MNIFEYKDYREFLRDYYNEQKRRNKGYSYRLFARHAALASPNYLKLVIEGTRRITDKSLPHFVKGLKLNDNEEQYFRAMVNYQESTDEDDRQTSLADIKKLAAKNQMQVLELSEARNEILKSWHHWAVREMVLLADFSDNPQWISEKLRGLISVEQAKESMELLLRLRFIIREAGKYVLSEPLISTSDEVLSPLLQNLHWQFSDLAMQTMATQPVSVREMSGLTLAVPKSSVAEIKAAIKKFRRELNQTFSTEGKNEVVYHLAVHFFPLTSDTRGEQQGGMK